MGNATPHPGQRQRRDGETVWGWLGQFSDPIGEGKYLSQTNLYQTASDSRQRGLRSCISKVKIFTIGRRNFCKFGAPVKNEPGNHGTTLSVIMNQSYNGNRGSGDHSGAKYASWRNVMTTTMMMMIILLLMVMMMSRFMLWCNIIVNIFIEVI